MHPIWRLLNWSDDTPDNQNTHLINDRTAAYGFSHASENQAKSKTGTFPSAWRRRSEKKNRNVDGYHAVAAHVFFHQTHQRKKYQVSSEAAVTYTIHDLRTTSSVAVSLAFSTFRWRGGPSAVESRVHRTKLCEREWRRSPGGGGCGEGARVDFPGRENYWSRCAPTDGSESHGGDAAGGFSEELGFFQNFSCRDASMQLHYRVNGMNAIRATLTQNNDNFTRYKKIIK